MLAHCEDVSGPLGLISVTKRPWNVQGPPNSGLQCGLKTGRFPETRELQPTIHIAAEPSATSGLLLATHRHLKCRSSLPCPSTTQHL